VNLSIVRQGDKLQNDISERLNHLSKSYTKTTGLSCSFLSDSSGDVDAASGDWDWSTLCLFCRASPVFASDCLAQDRNAASMSFDLGEPYIYLCPLGLTKWAVPVIEGEKFLGAFIAGQIRISSRLGKLESERPYHFDYFQIPWDSFRDTWNELPFRTPQQANYAAHHLFYSTCYEMGTDRAFLDRRRKIWAERSVFYEEISYQKKNRLKA
jgi:ligand-binding sensor protein